MGWEQASMYNSKTWACNTIPNWMLPVERLRRGKVLIKPCCVGTWCGHDYIHLFTRSLALTAACTLLVMLTVGLDDHFRSLLTKLFYSILYHRQELLGYPAQTLLIWSTQVWPSPTSCPQQASAPVAHSSAHGSPKEILSKISRRAYSLFSAYKTSMTVHIWFKREIRALISSSWRKSMLILLKKIVTKQNNGLKRERKRLGEKS